MLKIGLLPVASDKFTSPKISALQLRVAHVSVLNQYVLPVKSGCGKSCKPAIDELDSHQSDTVRMSIREVTTDQANILPYRRCELCTRELYALQDRTFDSKCIDLKICSLQILQSFFLNCDELAVRKELAGFEFCREIRLITLEGYWLLDFRWSHTLQGPLPTCGRVSRPMKSSVFLTIESSEECRNVVNYVIGELCGSTCSATCGSASRDAR